MKYENLIILNYLKNIFKSKQNSIPSIISITAIAISIFSLIVVLSFMKVFVVKRKQKIYQSVHHIIINTNKNFNLSNVSGIKSYKNTFETYSALIANKEFTIVKIKGLDKITDETGIDFHLTKQIPINISENFSVNNKKKVGDQIELFVPDFSENKPRIQKLSALVTGVTQESNLEVNIIFTANNYKNILNQNTETFIEIFLVDPFNSKEIKKAIIEQYNELEFSIVDWQALNSSLFKLMNLERLSLSIFLSFLILISATTIYSNMVSLITQKKKEIGTLLLLGSKKNSLILIFTFIGLLVGFIGVLIGSILATLVIFLLLETNLITKLSIDISFYQIEGFPIIFDPVYFIQIVLFSIFVIIVSSFLPSYFLLNKDLESLIRRES